MSGCHLISTKLDNGDLYVGLCGRSRRSLLCKENDGCSGVDEDSMLKLYWFDAAGFIRDTSYSGVN